MKALTYSDDLPPYNSPGNNGNTIPAPPLGCRTPLYTAGTGETAIAQVSVTASPKAPVNDVVYAFVGVWSGTTWSVASTRTSADDLSPGTGHATSFAVIPLEAGKPYVFGTSLATNAAVTLSPVLCQGLVQIVKTAP